MSSTPAPFIRGLVAVLAVLALILAMDTLRLFAEQQLLSSVIRIETQYFYALLAAPSCHTLVRTLLGRHPQAVRSHAYAQRPAGQQ